MAFLGAGRWVPGGRGGEDRVSIGAASALVDSPLVAAGAMAGWLREAITG
ncbi:MAG: hypothetical protein JNM66_19905 [Bryobacterales bacterium]|nr:hypothetical protein [Bryobacterales bacterium]